MLRRVALAAGLGAAALCLLLSAAPAAYAEGEEPPQLMRALEARLLAAPGITIEADVRATGALVAALSGRLELRERNRANASWQGELRGAPVQLALSSDGRALELKGGAQTRSAGTERESNRALIAGVLRTGLAHNLLRISSGQGPDHAEGGVESWATLEGFRPTTYGLSGDMQGAMSFGFDLVLDGVNAGSVRLWLDPVTGLPRRRLVVMRSPEGESTIVEDYRRFSLD